MCYSWNICYKLFKTENTEIRNLFPKIKNNSNYKIIKRIFFEETATKPDYHIGNG